MKSLGITRKVDTLGRIVIPSELRDMFGIKTNDYLEIYTDGGRIVLEKYNPSCIFCKETEDIFEFNDKSVCKNCARKMMGYIDE